MGIKVLEKKHPNCSFHRVRLGDYFLWPGLDVAMGYLKWPLDLSNVNLVLGHMNYGSYYDSQKNIIVMGMNDMSGRQKKVGGASLYFVGWTKHEVLIFFFFTNVTRTDHAGIELRFPRTTLRNKLLRTLFSLMTLGVSMVWSIYSYPV